jgi:hypothetical protein
MGFSRKRQSILVGLAKVIGAKWSRALALLLCKEEQRHLEGLVLKVLEEWLWHNVTYREVNTSNQSI